MDNSENSKSDHVSLLASANHGDAVAQLALAKVLLDNTESGRQHALKWLVRSARSGNVEAISLLKQMLLSPIEPSNHPCAEPVYRFDNHPDRRGEKEGDRVVEIDWLLMDLLRRVKRWKNEIHMAEGRPRGTLEFGMALSCIRRFDVLMRISLFRLLPLLGTDRSISIEDIAKGKPLQRLTFGECIGLLRQFDKDLTKGFRKRWPKFDLKGRLVGKKLEELLAFHSIDRNRLVHPKLLQKRYLKIDAEGERDADERARELFYANTEMGDSVIMQFLQNVEKVCESDFMLAVVVASGASDLDEDVPHVDSQA